MTCPVCQLERTECPACPEPCHTCNGAGELIDNPGWPDPQHERRFTCPTCHGEGVHNPDLNSRPETYTETWLRHTRENTDADMFDEAFDELLARQDRLDEYAGRQVTSGAQAPVTVIKGGGEGSACRPLESSSALSVAPPSSPMADGRTPSRPSAGGDDLLEAA